MTDQKYKDLMNGGWSYPKKESTDPEEVKKVVDKYLTDNKIDSETIDKKITDGVSKIVADAPEDFDTLKEMSDWFSQHSDSAAAMNSDILSNKSGIETLKNDIEPLKTEVNNNTNAIREINDNLSSEISRAKEADEILKSRVDVITSLPEGSTTGDAELQDIRVKADGTTATSAGNAVREQISELKSDIYISSEFYYPIEYGTFNMDGKRGTDANRIRTDFIKVIKGQSILIKNGNLEHACGMWKDSIIDSNCIRNDKVWQGDEKIYCEYDGYLIVVYKNKSNTDLSLSDFDGEIKTEIARTLKNMRDIDELKRKTSLYSSKNLCGMNSNILYPVDLKIGDRLTFSTSDSSNLKEDLTICLFDENKKRVDEFSFFANTNKRTIELIKDVKYKYITWRKKSDIPLQVELGITATLYEEYIYQQNELKSVIDKGYYELTPFTNGNWANNDLTVDITKRLRLQDFVQVKSGDKIKIKNGSLYHAVGLWDSSMNIYRNDHEWRTNDEDIYIERDGYAMLIFKKPTDEDISCNDFDGEIKLYNIYGSEKEEEIIIGNDELIIGNKKIAVYNPYKDKKKNKYKGQLHCHTTNSDGKWSVDKTMTKYSEAGYDFITITDHNFITEEPTDLHGMVWIGNSLEDTNNRAGYQHCNIIGAKSVVGKYDGYTNSNTVGSMINDYVKNQGAILQYNHPDDTVVYVSNNDLDNMPNGISLIEIYNSCDIAWKKTVSKKSDLPLTGNKLNDMFYCEEDGKKYFNRNFRDGMTNVWEVTETREPVEQERGFVHLLDAGKKVFGTATDDCHFDCTFNYGWIQVFANSRSKNAIMNGLLSGNFYASCGVELSDISVEDGQYIVNVENGENAIITFYGEGMKVLKVCNGTNAVYEFDGTEKYVRATIQIGDNKAWTQPVWLLSKKYNYEF